MSKVKYLGESINV